MKIKAPARRGTYPPGFGCPLRHAATAAPARRGQLPPRLPKYASWFFLFARCPSTRFTSCPSHILPAGGFGSCLAAAWPCLLFQTRERSERPATRIVWRPLHPPCAFITRPAPAREHACPKCLVRRSLLALFFFGTHTHIVTTPDSSGTMVTAAPTTTTAAEAATAEAAAGAGAAAPPPAEAAAGEEVAEEGARTRETGAAAPPPPAAAAAVLGAAATGRAQFLRR